MFERYNEWIAALIASGGTSLLGGAAYMCRLFFADRRETLKTIDHLRESAAEITGLRDRVEKLENEMSEAFRLIRETHGNVEYMAGLMHRYEMARAKKAPAAK